MPNVNREQILLDSKQLRLWNKLPKRMKHKFRITWRWLRILTNKELKILKRWHLRMDSWIEVPLLNVWEKLNNFILVKDKANKESFHRNIIQKIIYLRMRQTILLRWRDPQVKFLRSIGSITENQMKLW